MSHHTFSGQRPKVLLWAVQGIMAAGGWRHALCPWKVTKFRSEGQGREPDHLFQSQLCHSPGYP